MSARWFRGFFGVWTVRVHGTLRAAGKLRGTRTTVFSRHAVLFLYNASTLIFGLVPPAPPNPPPENSSPWDASFLEKLEFWDVYKYAETMFAKH